jgi:hypothetical protein
VIIHWLGEMFDPALEGYWGDTDHMKAMEVALDVIHAHADKVDGVKISLLTKARRSPCAAACRRACACTPATTSTTPN